MLVVRNDSFIKRMRMSFLDRILNFFLLPSKKTTNKMVKDAVIKVLAEMVIVESNEQGYSIWKNKGELQVKRNWIDIEKAELSRDKLVLHSNGKVADIIERSASNWFELIQNIPDNMFPFNESLVRVLIDELEGCEVCGLVALKDDRCELCGVNKWTPMMSEAYHNKSEYLKENQEDLFKDESTGEIKVTITSEAGFEVFKEWSNHMN